MELDADSGSRIAKNDPDNYRYVDGFPLRIFSKLTEANSLGLTPRLLMAPAGIVLLGYLN